MKISEEQALQLLEEGRSLLWVCRKFRKHATDFRHKLRGYDRNRYEKAVYGVVVGQYGGHDIYKLPKGQTDRTDSFSSFALKERYTREGYITEVGIWKNNFSKRIAIDLWHPEKQEGIQLVTGRNGTSKQIIKRMKAYGSLFGTVRCVIIGDKPLLASRIREGGFDAECFQP